MSIADAILTQIQQAGQPRTVKSTETLTAKEPIDIGGLGLLLYMLLEMNKKQQQVPGVTGPLPSLATPAGSVSPLTGLQGMGAGGVAGGLGFGAMDPMQLILKLFGASSRAPGMGGY